MSNYTFSITYKPGKGHVDADALSCIRWPEAIDIDTQTVHAVSKGVQASHGNVETLCQGAQTVDALCQDNAPPGMTPMQWCQAQAKYPAIHQIIDSIWNKTIKHLKIQGDMPSELKTLIRLKKQLLLKQGVLYRRVTPTDAKPRLQLILPPSHQNKAIEGCHDHGGTSWPRQGVRAVEGSILLARDVHRCSILPQQLSQVLEKKIKSRSSSSTEHRGQSTIGIGTFGLFEN